MHTPGCLRQFAPYNDNQQAIVMGFILLKIFIILAVVGVLALITLDDRRTRRLRAEEDRAKLEAKAGERAAQRRDDTVD
jgi:Tfp pilus assembly protein PilE